MLKETIQSNDISGVPQGLIPGAIQFNIFINDMDDGTESTYCRLADNAKLGGATETSDGCAAI